MICKKFNLLNPFEQVIYIGKLVHAVENDNLLFEAGNEIIDLAEKMGLFERVKILPNTEK